MGLPEDAQEKHLLRATKTKKAPKGLSFYNTSKMDLSTLGESGIKDNLETCVQSFSRDAREIFEQFKFELSLYARNLRPMLRETVNDEYEVDLSNVLLSQYRLSKIRQQDLKIMEGSPEHKLKPGDALGTARAKDKKEEMLSLIISRLNELFITDQLTESDLVNYLYTVRDKVRENQVVMHQIANNTPEQAMLGDFLKAIDDAIFDSSEAHQNQKFQLLADPERAKGFAKMVFELLIQGRAVESPEKSVNP